MRFSQSYGSICRTYSKMPDSRHPKPFFFCKVNLSRLTITFHLTFLQLSFSLLSCFYLPFSGNEGKQIRRTSFLSATPSVWSPLNGFSSFLNLYVVITLQLISQTRLRVLWQLISVQLAVEAFRVKPNQKSCILQSALFIQVILAWRMPRDFHL